ncbi:MAG: hypothetical protein ACI9YT_001584 [Halobacteriales archaeon]|jgi:hypothetical protein
MGVRRAVLLGAFLALVVLGSLLAAFTLSLTPTGRVVLLVFVGILLSIGIVAGGFVWWVRREIGTEGPSEAVQERVNRRTNDGDR